MSQRQAVAARIYLKYLNEVGVRFSSESSIGQCHSISLVPERPYTIGRWDQCDIVFSDLRVSKKHCQLFFNCLRRKIYILDGELVVSGDRNHCTVTSGLRDRLSLPDSLVEPLCVKASLNGVFINGVRIRKGVAAELSVGDEVMLICADKGICTWKIRIGFVIQRIVFDEQVVQMSDVDIESPLRLLETAVSAGHSQGSASSRRKKRIFALREVGEYQSCAYPQLRHDRLIQLIQQARLLSNKCRHILNSDDPVSCLRLSPTSDCMPASLRRMTNYSTSGLQPKLRHGDRNAMDCPQLTGDGVFEIHNFVTSSENVSTCGKLHKMPLNVASKPLAAQLDGDLQKKVNCGLAGRKIFLNHLNFMNPVSSSSHTVVSLKDLLYPVGSIVRIFVTTFTSDVLWFLSYCEIPSHLPVTVACHNAERCWNPSPDKRTSKPFPDFPNLELVFPQFPEAIAFGKDRKKQGVACHHPKLLVLQRKESMRIIITSANLVAKQWCTVTNTVWWQDFPYTNTPDYSTLFSQNYLDDSSKKRSDFSAQLAGFMAALLVDVPSQAHWIAELSKYDFGGASGYLVASVPGIHSDKLSFVPESINFSLASKYLSLPFGENFLGSIEASVVGLSHLFHSAADSNGLHLKRLAAFLGNFRGTAFGMLEIVLKRNKDVLVDPNAVSVFVPDQGGSLDCECIQLGFLPRNVAKWVSPLWDMGLFRFYGYILPEEALGVALGETKKKVKMILHVCKGPCFSDIPKMVQPMTSALCSLIAAVHRCVGLWRLKEVLGQYIWPECQETDFIYCSSSIGSSMNAQFLAAFSAATGKRSVQSFDSEESDPEWGCWSASQEKQSPSVQILFPTIDRVKNASCGILPSIRMLCFSEKTWNRMKDMNMLCDAVPNPPERVGYPMHVKVARRRFQSSMGTPSYGWVYCGSHNFSSAAWGRPISNPDNIITNGPNKSRSTLGLMLHVCNYELGIVFIVPPADVKDNICAYTDLDDIILPFVAPAPKYHPRDRPATKQAMKEAFAKLSQQNTVDLANLEEMEDDIPDEEEEFVEATRLNDDEKEEEKAYAESLWSQVDSNVSLGAETFYTGR